MPRSELGTKRTDPETGRKFYDLGKDPVISPYTGTSYPLSFFEAIPSAPSRYAKAAAGSVDREEDQDENAEERDEETDTVSLNDVEEDENDGGKTDVIDVDDEEEAEKDDDDTFLALDEDDDDVDDLIGERDEEDN